MPNRQTVSVLGTAIFLVVAPGTVAGLVPWWISRWRIQSPVWAFTGLRAIGILLAAAGLGLLLDSFARFAFVGLGTPAPVWPTRHLVVVGLYRYVRNPMYLAVVSLIVGQALLLGDLRVLLYGGLVWLCSHGFVLGYEEPTLRKSFGAEYGRFCANVPRWIPRARPWRT